MKMPKPGETIYFLGIGGTGMAAVAGILQEAGYRIVGSDVGIYPPMSTMLEELNIRVLTPYDPQNIISAKPALVVVANALSRGNPEIEYVMANGLPYTSFPEICGEAFIKNRIGVVVTGTHGKTTTTSLLCHILYELGEEPSFIVGGIPRNFPRSFRLAPAGKGKTFVIEGDEYDTAFFDKGPKFLHYYPNHLIVNNIEFDHADIYKNVEAIEDQFAKVCALVPETGQIIANSDDPGVAKLLSRLGPLKNLTRVATLGRDQSAGVRVTDLRVKALGPAEQLWSATISTSRWGDIRIETGLAGKHNLANVAQVIACLESLETRGHLSRPINLKALSEAIKSFKSVQRRLDYLGSGRGIDIYEDFAHHPTAVALVIEGFKQAYPSKRLLVAYEPRNATSRRNVFQNDYIKNLALADRVLIGPCPVDQRIPEDQRMSTAALVKGIGAKASAHPTNEELLVSLQKELRAGDAVIFMSSSSFSGVQYKLAESLRSE